MSIVIKEVVGKKDLKKFIAFLFVLPIVPSVLLWLKSEKISAVILLLLHISL